ncbi:DUF2975 domain-containing protein [Liquorilactobacillus uvarum]|nr:DUF2975 domain-containing protein [Liquorilactobacillus uvarum]
MKIDYKKIIRCLIVLMNIVLFCSALTLVICAVRSVSILFGDVKSTLVTSDSMLILQGHNHVSESAIENFSRIQYSLSFLIGVTLALAATYITIKALKRILENMLKEKLFILKNAYQMKRIVLAQILAILSDPFLSWADRLTRSQLGRSNYVIQSDFVSDAVQLLFVYIIYIAFKMAIQLKEENSLTI